MGPSLKLTGTALTLLTAGLLASPAQAQTRSQVYGDQLTKQSQTLYVRADVQATTYESDAVDSKEAFESTTVSVGAWTGEGRQVGIQMTSMDTDTQFTLNDSQVQTSVRDVRMMARLGWLVPSVGASLTEIDIHSGADQQQGLYATGINGGLQLAVPVTLSLVVSAEAMVSVPTKSYDKMENDMKIGQRTEGDIGAAYDLTERMVDLLVGYRTRSMVLEQDGEKLNERTHGAYAGLRLGVYF